MAIMEEYPQGILQEEYNNLDGSLLYWYYEVSP
jgi:hypothetical protein